MVDRNIHLGNLSIYDHTSNLSEFLTDRKRSASPDRNGTVVSHIPYLSTPVNPLMHVPAGQVDFQSSV